VPPKVAENAFDDLMGGFTASSSKKQEANRTIKEMRKEELSKTMDPITLKVKLK
jgi:hypothetical protein